MIKWLFFSFGCSLLFFSSCFGLTSLEDKDVPILRAAHIAREEPDWFVPTSLSGGADFDYWMSVLPFSGDRYSSDQYIVVPTLGLVAPVQFATGNDYSSFLQGKQVDINPYLQNGIMYYPGTSKLGDVGNSVYFGHSNYLLSDPGRYKSIFASIMSLDPIVDEVWYYSRQPSGEYLRDVYVVLESFETVPENVSTLLPRGFIENTLIGCTDGRNGRWIIKGVYKPATFSHIPNELFFSWYSSYSDSFAALLPESVLYGHHYFSFSSSSLRPYSQSEYTLSAYFSLFSLYVENVSLVHASR